MSPMPEIYYADDDRDDIDIFTEAVKVLRERSAAHVNLHVYHSGDSLIKGISERLVDTGTIFLDINMPGKTGFQVLCELKQIPLLQDIPVVMYSTSSDINIIRKSRSLGASLYAIKPNTFSEMNDLIVKVLSIDWATHIDSDDNFVINNKK